MIHLPAVLAAAVAAGSMSIRFRTQGPLDFANERYVVAFNTSGNGQIPLAASLAGFTNWSFELIFGGPTGASYALQQIYPNAGAYNAVAITIPPQGVIDFNPDSDGANHEFTFVFDRSILRPFVPTGTVATVWALNFFATDPNGNPLDSGGINGPNDAGPTCCRLTTTASYDQIVNKPNPPPYQPQNASAAIAAIEVTNVP